MYMHTHNHSRVLNP